MVFERESVEPRLVPWPSDPLARRTIVQQATKILDSGGLVAFPTDTVYGLAAHPLRSGAVEQLFLVKRRPLEKRIALLIAEPVQMNDLAKVVPEAARRLAELAWPGALTIVFQSKRPELGETVALRVPEHEVPIGIIASIGCALATTSANLSAEQSSTTAEAVLESLPVGYELLIDGGRCPGGVDSTVIDFSQPEPVLLRRGALDESILTAALGESSARRLLSV